MEENFAEIENASAETDEEDSSLWCEFCSRKYYLAFGEVEHFVVAPDWRSSTPEDERLFWTSVCPVCAIQFPHIARCGDCGASFPVAYNNGLVYHTGTPPATYRGGHGDLLCRPCTEVRIESCFREAVLDASTFVGPDGWLKLPNEHDLQNDIWSVKGVKVQVTDLDSNFSPNSIYLPDAPASTGQHFGWGRDAFGWKLPRHIACRLGEKNEEVILTGWDIWGIALRLDYSSLDGWRPIDFDSGVAHYWSQGIRLLMAVGIVPVQEELLAELLKTCRWGTGALYGADPLAERHALRKNGGRKEVNDFSFTPDGDETAEA